MSHYGNVTQVFSEIALSHVVARRSFGKAIYTKCKAVCFRNIWQLLHHRFDDHPEARVYLNSGRFMGLIGEIMRGYTLIPICR